MQSTTQQKGSARPMTNLSARAGVSSTWPECLSDFRAAVPVSTPQASFTHPACWIGDRHSILVGPALPRRPNCRGTSLRSSGGGRPPRSARGRRNQGRAAALPHHAGGVPNANGVPSSSPRLVRSAYLGTPGHHRLNLNEVAATPYGKAKTPSGFGKPHGRSPKVASGNLGLRAETPLAFVMAERRSPTRHVSLAQPPRAGSEIGAPTPVGPALPRRPDFRRNQLREVPQWPHASLCRRPLGRSGAAGACPRNASPFPAWMPLDPCGC